MKKTTLSLVLFTSVTMFACGQFRVDGSYWSPEPSSTPTDSQKNITDLHTNCSKRTVADAKEVRKQTSLVSNLERDEVYYNPMLKRELPKGSIIIDKRDYENFLYALYMKGYNVIRVERSKKKDGFLVVNYEICN